MKNTMKILLIFVLFSALKCEKEKDPLPAELPPATQTGENTFGCKIDGKIFVAESGTTWTPIVLSSIIITDFPKKIHPYLSFSAHRRGTNLDFTGQFLFSNLGEIITEGSYTLGFPNGIDTLLRTVVDINNKRYKTDSLNGGEFIITKLDTIEKIVSGTFYFDAMNKNSEIIKVTEGRFDIKG